MSSWRQPRRARSAATGAMTAVLLTAVASCADGVGPGSNSSEQLLFVRHADGFMWQSTEREIYRINSDGSGIQNLTSSLRDYRSLSLSPDGGQLAFHVKSASDTRWGVWVMNTDGSGLTHLTRGRNPRWSPDGNLIAYENGHVWVMNADGSNPREVSGDLVAPCGSEDLRIRLIGWLPSGRLVFAQHICREGDHVYTANPDGTDLVEHTTDRDVIRGHWSPDRTKVAYTARAGCCTQRLYVMNADGSDAREVTEQGAHHYVTPRGPGFFERSEYSPWSPDGTRLVFYMESGSLRVGDDYVCTGTSLPYVVNVDGTALRKLGDICAEFNGWSPAGDRIAFSQSVADDHDAYLVAADGGQVIPLTASPVPVSDVIWLHR